MNNGIDERLRAAADEMEEIAKDLAPENNRVRVNSTLFKQYFLPLLTGAVKDDRPVVKEWIAVVGSPTAEAEVVNDNGEVVVIPPLFDTSLVKDMINTPDNTSMSDIVIEAVEETAVFPEKAASKLEKTLEAATDLSVTSPVNERWIEVMKSFGVISEEEAKETPEGSSEANDLFEFD